MATHSLFTPANRMAEVATIERWNGPARDFATAGESIAITLSEQLFIERGQVATTPNNEYATLNTASRFVASLFWMGPDAVKIGERVILKLATQEVGARIVAVSQVLDPSTLETTTGSDQLSRNDVAEVTMETERPVAFDLHDAIPTLGRFVLLHNRRVAGGGIIVRDEVRGTREESHLQTGHGHVSASAPHPSSLSPHPFITSVSTGVGLLDRATRNGHRAGVVWLTGLSGAGKSTIATAVNRALFEQGWQATLLDGDNLRHGLCAGLGFSPEDRTENLRRAAHAARLLTESGLIVLSAFISPLQADRERVRAIVKESGAEFIEVFVDTPLAVCEERDPKGLYKKARAGEIAEFTGISAPYEAPTSPEIHLTTAQSQIEETAGELLRQIVGRFTANPLA